MRFCRNCIYHLGPSATMQRTSELSPNFDLSRCGHESALDHSVFLVTGRPADVRRLYASTQRMLGAPCGPEGHNWTPMPKHEELSPSDYPTHLEAADLYDPDSED